MSLARKAKRSRHQLRESKARVSITQRSNMTADRKAGPGRIRADTACRLEEKWGDVFSLIRHRTNDVGEEDDQPNFMNRASRYNLKNRGLGREDSEGTG